MGKRKPEHQRMSISKRGEREVFPKPLPSFSQAEQKALTRDSVIMEPEADQVKTSICPGVSIRTYLQQKGLVFLCKEHNQH